MKKLDLKSLYIKGKRENKKKKKKQRKKAKLYKGEIIKRKKKK